MFFIIFKRWLLWGLSLTRGTTSFPEITFGGLYEKTLQRLLVVDGADGHVEGSQVIVEYMIYSHVTLIVSTQKCP